MIAEFVHRGKDHSDLKPNARLRGRNLHRATVLHEAAEMFVERDGLPALAGEKLPDRIAATRVRHIRIDELPTALGTGPEWT